jgi:hypothetical protein
MSHSIENQAADSAVTAKKPDLSLEQTAAERVGTAFEHCVSTPRFKRYLRDHAVKSDAMGVYLWNVALCSALYPALQCLEITYRNALNDALRDHKGTDAWYDDPYLLFAQEQQKVIDAKNELRKQGKPVDPCRVVAELSFGFWVALYSGPYAGLVVHPTLKQVFPNAPKRFRNHGDIADRLQETRKLRNRVFHHEPIWHWAKPPVILPNRPELLQQYKTVAMLTEWIGTGKVQTYPKNRCL